MTVFRGWRILAAALAVGAPAVHAQAPEPVAATGAELTIHADQPGPVFSRQIFSQFAEHLGTGIYGGLWVGPKSKIKNTRGFRNDVVGALRDLSVPVIRWPGGCFADEYHWREGVGPQGKRPVKINTNWGGVTEPNAVGTHEFMDLAEQIGADAYISGNVGSGSPQEMAEWVEYMTSPAGSLADERARNGHKAPWKVAYFGIGNELWGCGGNMRPEYAADVTRRYATYIKTPAGTTIQKIASGANTDDYAWTGVMMREAAKQVDAVSLHYYTVPGGGWPPKASATQFDEAGWAETLAGAGRMEELITKHSAEMDKIDPQKKTWLAVDEWGTWYAPEPGTNPGFLQQQNSLRDALVAAVNFNIFAKHADRVRLSAIAQMVNVLQSMIMTRDDKMVLTPTYHVFAMYKAYMGATVLPLELKSPWYNKDRWTMPAVSASAVRDSGGVVHVGLANLDPNHAMTVSVRLPGLAATTVGGRILTAPAMTAINTFDRPDAVKPAAFTGAALAGDGLRVTLPAKSVVMLDLK
nr:alpha-L-arabinofuranosidase C-terminal domain-containing protein [Polymorphobacter sp.]